MVQFYTLEEAAARLQLTPDQLRDMAKKNEIRAFQDRGKLRFRASEIDELARTRGLGSDPELQLGDKGAKTSEPKSGGPKSPNPKTVTAKPGKPTQYVAPSTDRTRDMPIDAGSEEVPLGQDPAPAASGSKNTPRTSSTRSPSPKRAGPTSPPPSPRPKPGSDSDVRLVGEGSSLEFEIDSDPKVEKSPSPGPKTPGSSRNKSKADSAADSGVRIVPLDSASDSDVKIVPDEPDSNVVLGPSKSKTPSDSDIRLEGMHPDSGKTKMRDEKNLVTEEIDLDAEELKAAQEAAAKKKSKTKPREGSSAQLPKVSPFELSDPDVKLEPKPEAKTAAKRASKVEPEKKKIKKEKTSETEDSSSDFDLTPMKDLSSSPLDLGSDEMTPIKLDDSEEEEVGLGELTGPGGSTSGINLKDPIDSGISLEQGGSDEMEIEEKVSPSSTPSNTPRPSAQVDSSSEFELSLDDSDAEEEGGTSSSSEFELTLDEPSSPTEEGSSSEFELSLDMEESSSVEMESTEQGSDSEFELTIDDAGGLDLEDSAALEEEDKDIFETDFDVPALDEESGSEAVALDEEGGESSDFDLDVDDEDADTDAESGSEVVALDEDEEIQPTKKKKKGGRTAVAEDEDEQEAGDFADLEEETEEPEQELEEEPEPEEEIEEEEVAAAPARRSWGIVAPLCATLTSVLLFFVCLMSYEMIQGMWGYHKQTKTSSLIVDPLARSLFGENFPKE